MSNLKLILTLYHKSVDGTNSFHDKRLQCEAHEVHGLNASIVIIERTLKVYQLLSFEKIKAIILNINIKFSKISIRDQYIH